MKAQDRLLGFFAGRRRKLALTGACALLLAGAAPGQEAARGGDPTELGAPLAQALHGNLGKEGGLAVIAVVVGAAGSDGVAMVRTGAQTAPAVVRTGSVVSTTQNGIPLRLEVTGVGADGIELAGGAAQGGITLEPSIRGRRNEAAGPDGTPAAGRLALVEFNGVDLDQALRLLADQSGRNFSASPDAARTPVTLCLRNAPVEEVLEQICSANRLWMPPSASGEDGGGTIRIQTLAEFEGSLSSYQQGEQLSKVYTLLYPNVTEIASVIYGLYRDRVRLYLGDDDILEDDLNDLSRRFDRLNMLSSGSSELVEGFTSGNAGNGSGGSGTVYSQDHDGQWRRLSSEEAAQARGAGPIRKLSADEAKLIATAATDAEKDASGGAALLADARLVPPAIFVTVARRSNMLILRCIDPRIMEDLDRIIRQLDVPSPMVLLDVKVLEVSLGDGLDTIFDYVGQDKFHYHHHERSGSESWSLPATSLLEKGLTFEVITEKLSNRVQLLQERGQAKVVATPSLLTVNNEASQLFMGKEVPIVRNVSSTTYLSGENVVSVPSTEFEFQRVGTSLLITPNVNANGTVTLRLLEENSELSATKGSIPIYTDSGTLQYFDVDVVESRSVAGTFVAQDRQTIAIGGLVREETADQVAGIPLLMDIPLLGWFFRSTHKVTSRNELVIFLTPYVMQSPADALGATQAYAERNLQFDATRAAASVAPLTDEQKDALRASRASTYLPPDDSVRAKAKAKPRTTPKAQPKSPSPAPAPAPVSATPAPQSQPEPQPALRPQVSAPVDDLVAW